MNSYDRETLTEAGPPRSNVIRWEDPDVEHDVIAELRARPGDWAVLQENVQFRPMAWGPVPDPPYIDAVLACTVHDRVQMERVLSRVRARWVPDDEWALIEAQQMEAIARRDKEAGGPGHGS